MRRLIVFALVLCGCTQETPHEYSPSSGFSNPNPSVASTYRPGEPTRIGECPFTVEFPGPPTENSKQLPNWTTGLVDRSLTLTYENSSMAFSVSCGCSNTTRFGDITRIEALSSMETSAKRLEVSLLYYDYEESKLGKMVHFEGDMPSTQGPLKLDGRRYYFGQCSVGVIVGGKLKEYKYDQAMTFLKSTARIDIAPKPTPPPSGAARPILNDPTVLCHLKDSADLEISLSVCNSRGGSVTPAGAVTPSAPPSVADRLQALKDLLDRKVITPEESTAKRKEILKAL